MSKFSVWLASLTRDSSPDAAADYLVSYDASAATSKKVLMGDISVALGAGIPLDGWVVAGETWVYVSADDPTYVFKVAGIDLTGKYQAGQKIKYTQSTGGTKYGIITKVGFSTDTTITVYQGTDYDMANEAISNPYYSPVKTPFGFPMSPAKWTVEFLDTAIRTQATPANGTWYNIGTSTVSLPIGVWDVSYQVLLYLEDVSTGGWVAYTTLSTANNSEMDKSWSNEFYWATANLGWLLPSHRRNLITLTAKTSYFLNAKVGSANLDNLRFVGADGTTIIRAVCVYL